MRWLDKLGDFTFEVIHLPGTENKAADALSRAHVVSALEIGEEARQNQLRGWGEIRTAAEQDLEYQKEREEVERGCSIRGREVKQGVIIDQVDRAIVPRDLVHYERNWFWKRMNRLFVGILMPNVRWRSYHEIFGGRRYVATSSESFVRAMYVRGRRPVNGGTRPQSKSL